MGAFSIRWLWLLWACLWGGQLDASWNALRVLQPTEYRSPSGLYQWRIDPSERSGAGVATYTLLRDGKLTFSGQLTLTLQRAAVSDEGILLGFGYTKGDELPRGDFVVAMVDPNGRLRELTREPRSDSAFLHTSANPQGLGVIIDAGNSRAIVRVEDADINRGSESWWLYSLPEGTPIQRLRPRDAQSDNASLRRILGVQPVSGTPLLLVQWAKSLSDTRFALLDVDFNAVWTLDRTDEYRDLSTQRLVYEHGAILDAGARHFSLWLGASRERVEFKLTRQATSDAWQVEEAARHPQTVLKSTTRETVPVAMRVLPLIGSIELDAAQPRAPVPFQDFGIDDRGRFGLLRCACGKIGSFQLLQADGVLEREIALDFLPSSASLTITWIAGDRWLLTASDREHATGYWLDAATGAAESVTALRSPPISQAARDGLGGFVALTTVFTQYSAEDSLRAFDAEGRERWVVGQQHGSDDHVFSPEDLTVTSDGVIVVLENITDQLKRFDRNGRALGSLSLKDSWGRDPNYASGIEADDAGGVIVYDFQGSPEFVAMRPDGSLGEAYTPILPDRRRFRPIGNVQMGLGGQRWTSDGSALMRLAADGTVAQVIGAAPGGETLEMVANMHITRGGRIHAVDRRSGAVHVFNADGRREMICRPDVEDYDQELSLPAITVSDAGEIYVERAARGDRAGYVRYSKDCTRIGVESATVDSIAETWLAQPGSERRWVLGHEKLYLLNADGTQYVEQGRDAQGHWLIDPALPASADDGSLVLYTGHLFGHESAAMQASTAFVLYDAKARALRQIPAPAGVAGWANLSYAGNLISFIAEVDSKQRAVHIADLNTGAIRRVTQATTKSIRAWLVQPAGKLELWVFDGDRRIDRVALSGDGG